MDNLTIFSVVVLAGLIHAGFHLSVSVLTLLSGHTISRERSHLKLVKLITGFTLGAGFMNLLLFSSLAFVFQILKIDEFPPIVWTILVGLLVGTGLAVWLFYYKKPTANKPSEMWVPRDMAKFLSQRASKTNHTAEAFSLGGTSIVSELIFILAPLLTAVLLSLHLEPAPLQLMAVAIYGLIASLPLIIITILVSGGSSIAKIQIWRENYKHFLQLISASGLVILAIFIYSFIISPIVAGVSL